MKNEDEVITADTSLLPDGGINQQEETKIETVMGETEEILPSEERIEKKEAMPFNKRLKWAIITFIAIIVIANQINSELSTYLAIIFALVIYFIEDVMNYINKGGRLE